MPGPSETSKILNYSNANSVAILGTDVQINASGRDLIRGKTSGAAIPKSSSQAMHDDARGFRSPPQFTLRKQL